MKKGREAAGEVEKQQQINIAKAAAQTPGLKHYIMSSLPAASLSSNGKLPVPHFDYKHEAFQWIEEHAPELAAKTTRVWLGWYPSNMAFNAMMKLVHLVSSSQTSGQVGNSLPLSHGLNRVQHVVNCFSSI